MKFFDILNQILSLLKSFWDTSKYILFSIALSSVIVSWDIVFVFKHFPINKLLAVFMMAQVELSYIVLPYMVDYSLDNSQTKFYKKITLNWIMRIVFFIASMTPAALGVTDMFLDKMTADIKTEPVLPTKPTIDAQLDRDIEIERYKEWQKQDNHLKELEKKKSDYRERLAKYENDLSEYPHKKEAYDEYKKKGNITIVFDVIMLALGFIIMVSLQVMNGYASSKGAKSKRPRERRPRQKQPEQPGKPEKPEAWPPAESTFSNFRGDVPVGIPHNRG